MENEQNTTEHKFDTLSLLAGLSKRDSQAFNIDDILKEFGTPNQKNPDLPTAGKKQDQTDNPGKTEEYSAEQLAEMGSAHTDENAFIESIQQALNHEMEMTSSLPDPVIDLDAVSEDNGSQKTDNVTGEQLTESEALMKRLGIKLVEHVEEMPPDVQVPHQEVADEPDEKEHDEPENIQDRFKKVKAEVNTPKITVNNASPEADKTVREQKTKRPRPQIKLNIQESHENKTADDGESDDVLTGTAENHKKSPKKHYEASNIPDADVLLHETSKRVRKSSTAMVANLLLAVLSVILTFILTSSGNKSSADESKINFIYVLAGIMIAGGIFSWRQLKDGLIQLFTLKISANGMYLIGMILSMLSLLSKDKTYVNPAFCILTFAAYRLQRGDTMRDLAVSRSLRVMLDEKRTDKYAAVSVENAYNGNCVLTKGPVDDKGVIKNLLARNFSDQIMEYFSVAAVIVSFVLAAIIKEKTEISFLTLWSTFVSLLLPAGVSLAYSRIFANFSYQLAKKNQAVAGWKGISQLDGSPYLLMRDKDLYSTKQLKFGGVKLYRALSMGQAASYAASVLDMAGSSLAPLFIELRNANKGRDVPISQFHIYESGGFGARVAGDVVLIGSQRFMQLMGIKMEQAAKINGAIYMSVNSSLSAVFVVNYTVSDAVRNALRHILGVGSYVPLCGTIDFMLTPRQIAQAYRIDSERIEFPNAEARSNLAVLPAELPCSPIGIVASDSYASFIHLLIKAKRIAFLVRISAFTSIAGCLITAFLVFVSLLTGKLLNINAFIVLIVSLFFSIPAMILSNQKK